MSAVLVTGATGLIGTNLVRALVRRGERVRVLVRPESPRHGFAGLAALDIRVGDILDFASVRRAMSGIERIYHVAGRVCMGPFLAEWTRRVNVEGTETVLRAAVDAGVKRVVYTSTISTIGQGTADRFADEETFFACPRFRSPYYESKMAAERVALGYLRRGVDVVIVNPAVVFGPWDLKPSSGKIISLALRIGGYPVYPLGVINVVGVHDVVAGHMAAMDRGRSGERYALGNENLTYKELFDQIAQVAQLRRAVLPFNLASARPFVIWGDLMGQVFPLAFENFNSLVAKKMQERQFVTCNKARDELELPQTPIRQVIEETVRWFRGPRDETAVA